ncbi:alpha/beta hydrolase [Micromonospora sp. WMMD975]|uniref:alpha/beta fold hydrolase n=1 Tax=Micromonospora sp. WMMD975 TaxID=3016087 RepID=UPI00249B8BDB|nr:alpha/beta hydrolase [Micromonospora sp. WMMD975]WFE31887.1 alpha/beta hydrolase [Micromonospora sp. WMMD975]
MDHFIPVDRARIHYQVRGSGPVLFISQSGEGDANRTVDLAGHLDDRFTVITYDRRGLSRSILDEPTAPVSLRQHAADAVAVLRQVTDQPATMLGLSLGAAIGLHILAEHPGVVGTLIAHEPIALGFLDARDADTARQELAGIVEVHRDSGWRAAAAQVARVLGINPHDQQVEPGITAFPFTDQRAANFEFFLANDLAAVLDDTLTLADVAPDARIIPAVGRSSPPDGFDYLAGLALAEHLGAVAERFPGGHNGNLTHPRAFASKVRDLL